VSPAKTVEAIQMSFGLWAWVGPRNHMLDWGSEILRDVALATNLETTIAITGFVDVSD